MEFKKYLEVNEVRGEGQGVGGTKQGDGGADMCKCVDCDNEQVHKKGTPCTEMKCEECGGKMVGINKEEKEV